MNVSEIVLGLDVVSKIGINDKLVTSGSTFNVRTNTYMRALSRWWYDEGRGKDYESLRSLFGAAINVSELLALRKDYFEAARVISAITPALKGLSNLAQTYRDDIEVHARFTRLQKDVEGAVGKLEELLAPNLPPAPDNESVHTSSSPAGRRIHRTGSSSG